MNGEPLEDESAPLLADIKEEAHLAASYEKDDLKEEANEHTRESIEESDGLVGECRICQDEDCLDNLEKPCACTGSMLYAHKRCVQRWIEEKGNTTCEVCHQNFQGDYQEPTPRPSSQDGLQDLSQIGALFQTIDLAAAAAAERYISNAETQRRQQRFGFLSSSPQFSFLRSALACCAAILLLRVLFNLADNAESGGDPSFPAFIMIFILRLLGPLVPFCLMYQTVLSLRRHHQAQENAMAAAEVAWMIQGARGLANRRFGLQTLHTPGTATNIELV